MSAFKIFVQNLWFEHKKEKLVWEHKPVTEYDCQTWFSENKWFIKRLFKEK